MLRALRQYLPLTILTVATLTLGSVAMMRSTLAQAAVNPNAVESGVGAIEIARVPGLRPATREVRVQFARGRSSATLTGQVRGYNTVDYLLNARAGQQMTVHSASDRSSTLRGIYAANGEEICVESCGEHWSGILPRDGDYTVRMGLMRAEARRGTQANYSVTVSITTPRR
jgi:hypothetical protein